MTVTMTHWRKRLCARLVVDRLMKRRGVIVAYTEEDIEQLIVGNAPDDLLWVQKEFADKGTTLSVELDRVIDDEG